MARWCGGMVEVLNTCPLLCFLLMANSLLIPIAFATCWHPSDAVGFQLWLQGFAVPRYMTHTALNAGFGAAVLALAVLGLVHYQLVVFIYRRAGFFVQLWPLALFLVGGVANGLWWLKTGYFDPEGAMAGLSPVLITIACHGVCERLGGEFVFGPNKPQYDGGY